MTWKNYRKPVTTPMRPYEQGEDLSGVSVAAGDQPPQIGGMIARNPLDPEDQWYISPEYFAKNYVQDNDTWWSAT